MNPNDILLIEPSGNLGIGMRENVTETSMDGDWNYVEIDGKHYSRILTHQEGDYIIIRQELQEWQESKAAIILRIEMGVWKLAGLGKWADRIEAGGDGNIYSELGDYIPTGKYNLIAECPISQCRFLKVETYCVPPSIKLHVNHVEEMNDYKSDDPTFETLSEALKEAVEWSDRDVTVGIWDLTNDDLLYIVCNQQLFVHATDKFLKELME